MLIWIVVLRFEPTEGQVESSWTEDDDDDDVMMMMITKTLLMTCWFGTDLYWHRQKKVSTRPFNAAICNTSSNEVSLHECTPRHLPPFIVHPTTTTCRHNFSSPACTCLEHTTVYIALPFTNARPSCSPVCRVEGEGILFCFRIARAQLLRESRCLQHNFLHHFPVVT